MSDKERKEAWFWVKYGYNLAIHDAYAEAIRLAELQRVSGEEKTALYYAAEQIRKLEKMDSDSPESKEVDVALLAQCTCGGVAGARACTIECAIFSGIGAPDAQVPPVKIFTRRGTVDEALVDKAQGLITSALRHIGGMGGGVTLGEEQLNLLRMAIDTPKLVMNDEIKQCPQCESSNLKESVVTRTVSRTFELDTISKEYNVVANMCADCGTGTLDYRAEEAEMQALVKMLHDEVHRLRKVVKEQAADLADAI